MMNSRVKVLIGIIIFIGVIVGADRLLKMQTKSSVQGLDESSNSLANGGVLEVTSDTFEQEVLQSSQKVLIDFYATWCGPCKMLSPIVEEVASDNETVKYVKIDVDKAEKISAQYGISAIPTLVVMENGKEVNRSVGLISKEQVEGLIK